MKFKNVLILFFALLVLPAFAQSPQAVRQYVGWMQSANISQSDIHGLGLPKIAGTWYHVDPKNGNDARNGKTFRLAVASLDAAYELCTSGDGDGIILWSQGTTTANTTSYLSAPLEWSKHGITVYGASAPVGIFQRSRVASGIDTLAALIILSGNNNTFINVHFYNAPDDSLGGIDVAQHSAFKIDGGDRNAFVNCSFVTVPDKATTSKTDLWLKDCEENYFYTCTFGTDTWDVGNTAASHILLEGLSLRNRFIGGETMALVSTGVAFGAVKSAGASSIGRNVIFRDMIFHVYEGNSDVSAQASWFIGTAPTSGLIILHNCLSVGYAEWDSSAGNDRVYTGMATAAAASAGGIGTTK